MPPGLRYTRDEQCQAIIGESGSYYHGILSDICTVLQCYRPSTNNIIDFEGRALDLTTCGNHMVLNGFCTVVMWNFSLLRNEWTILLGLLSRSTVTSFYLHIKLFSAFFCRVLWQSLSDLWSLCYCFIIIMEYPKLMCPKCFPHWLFQCLSSIPTCNLYYCLQLCSLCEYFTHQHIVPWLTEWNYSARGAFMSFDIVSRLYDDNKLFEEPQVCSYILLLGWMRLLRVLYQSGYTDPAPTCRTCTSHWSCLPLT